MRDLQVNTVTLCKLYSLYSPLPTEALQRHDLTETTSTDSDDSALPDATAATLAAAEPDASRGASRAPSAAFAALTDVEVIGDAAGAAVMENLQGEWPLYSIQAGASRQLNDYAVAVEPSELSERFCSAAREEDPCTAAIRADSSEAVGGGAAAAGGDVSLAARNASKAASVGPAEVAAPVRQVLGVVGPQMGTQAQQLLDHSLVLQSELHAAQQQLLSLQLVSA